MTLAKGDILTKLDGETGEPISSDRESYVQWEISGLTSIFGPTSVPAPVGNGLKELGIQMEESAAISDLFQIVLLRKIK